MKRPSPDDLIIVGRIAKPHGVKGELKVVPESDDIDQFFDFEVVHIGANPSLVRTHEVSNVRLQHSSHGVTVLLSLEGLDSREKAAQLVKMSIYVAVDDLSLEEDEYFLHDLVGCQVCTNANEPIGVVKDILEMPAHLVYVVGNTGKPDVMIPGIEPFIEDVDLDARRITIRPIEGLLDQ